MYILDFCLRSISFVKLSAELFLSVFTENLSWHIWGPSLSRNISIILRSNGAVFVSKRCVSVSIFTENYSRYIWSPSTNAFTKYFDRFTLKQSCFLLKIFTGISPECGHQGRQLDVIFDNTVMPVYRRLVKGHFISLSRNFYETFRRLCLIPLVAL